MLQTLFWAPTIFKIMVLGGVLAGAFSQRYCAKKIGLSIAGQGSQNYDNWLFNNLNFLIFLCTNFLYITTSSGLSLSLPDFQAKQDNKIALAVLAGPLLNIACACVSITAALFLPSIATAAHFFAISQLMAAIITLMPFPPTSGHYLLALACPHNYRAYLIEKTILNPRWERHVHVIVLWLAASSSVGQMALHTILHSSFQILSLLSPALLLGAGLASLTYAAISWRTPKLSVPSVKTNKSSEPLSLGRRAPSPPESPSRKNLRASRLAYFGSGQKL